MGARVGPCLLLNDWTGCRSPPSSTHRPRAEPKKPPTVQRERKESAEGHSWRTMALCGVGGVKDGDSVSESERTLNFVGVHREGATTRCTGLPRERATTCRSEVNHAPAGVLPRRAAVDGVMLELVYELGGASQLSVIASR